MKRKLRIIVSGMIAGDPWQGGATWAVLQYVLGFRQLGHEILFIEPIAAKALRPGETNLRDSENAAYFDTVMADFELSRDSALLLSGTNETFGLSYEELQKRAQSTDLLINISGMLNDETLITAIPARIYLDLDPAFNQLWSAIRGIDMRFAGHTHFVTVGLNLGGPGCTVPNCGRDWVTTLQPVVLDHWPVASAVTYNALTTVANWRGYGSIEHEGRHYGQKAHSLRQFMALPTQTTEQFMLALSIHAGETKDLEALSANCWHLLNPTRVACSPAAYQEFIQGSKAEFGVAKSGYVISRCGWFSDRSICYLASGRPVIAQETGFSGYLPTGNGLFAFQTTNDVLTSIDALKTSYQKHSQRARTLAEEYFDSRKVLTGLLNRIGV